MTPAVPLVNLRRPNDPPHAIARASTAATAVSVVPDGDEGMGGSGAVRWGGGAWAEGRLRWAVGRGEVGGPPTPTGPCPLAVCSRGMAHQRTAKRSWRVAVETRRWSTPPPIFSGEAFRRCSGPPAWAPTPIQYFCWASGSIPRGLGRGGRALDPSTARIHVRVWQSPWQSPGGRCTEAQGSGAGGGSGAPRTASLCRAGAPGDLPPHARHVDGERQPPVALSALDAPAPVAARGRGGPHRRSGAAPVGPRHPHLRPVRRPHHRRSAPVAAARPQR